MKGSFRLLLLSVIAVPFTHAYAASHQGPPEITVAGVVDTNVVNTVNTKVVNTISAAQLEGINFNAGVSSGGTISLIRSEPFKLRSISTSIAPDIAGELCTINVSIGEGDPTPLGLGTMSNGQASTVSRNYDVPIEPVSIIVWRVQGNAAFCNVSLAVAGEVTGAPETLQQRSAEPSMRIEVN